MEVLVCRNNVYPLPSVLQFVPRNVDIGFCDFSQRIEKGLTMAFMEVSKQHQEFYNFTVQVRRKMFLIFAFFSSLPVVLFNTAGKMSQASPDALLSRSCRTVRLCNKVFFFFFLQNNLGPLTSLVSSLLKRRSKKMVIHIKKH